MCTAILAVWQMVTFSLVDVVQFATRLCHMVFIMFAYPLHRGRTQMMIMHNVLLVVSMETIDL